MTPKEIAQLEQQSPDLRWALAAVGRPLYTFLRQQVRARYGYFPQGAHTCERCHDIVYPTLASPYNCFNPGWCIRCVLRGFFTPGFPLYTPFQPPVPTREQIERLIQYKRDHQGPI